MDRFALHVPLLSARLPYSCPRTLHSLSLARLLTDLSPFQLIIFFRSLLLTESLTKKFMQILVGWVEHWSIRSMLPWDHVHQSSIWVIQSLLRVPLFFARFCRWYLYAHLLARSSSATINFRRNPSTNQDARDAAVGSSREPRSYPDNQSNPLWVR